MTSVQNIPPIARPILNNEQSQKRTTEGHKQLQGRKDKQGQSFQAMLEKTDGAQQTIDRKSDTRSNQGKQGGEPREEGSKPTTGGAIGISQPTPPPTPPVFHLPPTITGTSGRDVLIGTSGHDIIDGKNGNDLILGGRGDDRLLGSQGNDLLSGGRGHDSLSGGQGNDWLLGGSGHDKLDGGIGNDWLFGGQGHDTLNGGRGNDHLKGGAGNDTFADESGNNRIDGGRGFDTFNLGKGIDSYHISVNKQGEFTIQELSKRFDSPVHTVKNVESFQFADIKISASGLRDRVNNPTQDLPLTKPQKAAVESVFNINHASVLDNDKDGKISEGDTVSGTLFRETGTINVSFEVSQDNADHINGTLGAKLPLSSERLQQVDRVVNPNPELLGVRGVLDADNSGGLSIGDVVYSRSNRLTTGGDPIGGSPAYHRLTADDMHKINAGNPLPLTLSQSEALNEVLSIRGALAATVLDNDGNSQLSQGDIVVISGGISGGEINRVSLTADQVSHINGEFGPRLDLSLQQITRLIGGPLPSDFGYYALDSDNSGELSVGDKLVTFGTFTVDGVVNPEYRTLTVADIQAIADPTAGLIAEISNVGINLSEGQDIPFQPLGDIRVDKQQLPAYLDKPFEQHIISTPSQLNQLRADLGLPTAALGGALPGTELPNVDFSQQVLVYSLRDAADPNATQNSFKLNNEGTLSNQALTTLIGFQASDEARIVFFALPREGIEQFANSDPITGEEAGPEVVPPEIDNQEIRQALEDSKRKWIEAGLSQYKFTLERTCFCTEEARRPVDNSFDHGNLNSVFHDGSEGEVPDSNRLNVKDMFKIIDDALSRHAEEIRVEYHSRLGYPTSIYIDYDQRLADEELSLTIRNFGLAAEIQDPAPITRPPVEVAKPWNPGVDHAVTAISIELADKRG